MKKKLHILAVDDEPGIGESLVYALDALAKVAKEKFDVVITDHRMPRSGGLELVRKLRQLNYEGRIVVLSAHLSADNIGTYEQLAVDEIVAKPFDFEELRDIITGLEEEVEF